MRERDCHAWKEDDSQVNKVQRTSLSGRKNKENGTVFKVKKQPSQYYNILNVRN